MAALSFLVASTFVLLSSLLVVRQLRLADVIDSGLAFVTVALAQVLVSLLVAGVVFGSLTRGAVLAVNASVLATLLFVERLRPGSWRPNRLEIKRESIAAEVRAHRWLYALVLLAAGEFVWRLLVAYVLPPYGFDALWYHLTAVAGWLQAERIGLNHLALWASVYPLNGELFFTWPTVFLRNDTWVDAVQLGFAVIGGVAVAGIARGLGLSARAAASAGLLFFLTPIVISQSTSDSVDLVFVSTFLVAYHFLLRFLRTGPFAWGEGNRPDLRLTALAGIAAGIALGAKSLGLLYCAALALLLFVHLAYSVSRRRLQLPVAVLSFVLFLVPLVVLGGFWYVRTWAKFENPFYPVEVDLLGHTLFSGLPVDNFLSAPPYPGSWWRSILGQWHQDQFLLVKPHYFNHDGRPSGFGPLWGYIAAPLLPVFAFAMLRRNRAALVNFLLPVAVVFLAQPYNWWSRFTMLVLAAGLIGVSYVIQEAPRKLATPLKATTLALVLVGLWFCTAKIDNGFSAPSILRRLVYPSERSESAEAVYGAALEATRRAKPGTRIGVDTSSEFFGGGPRIWYIYPLFGSSFDHVVYPLRGADRQALLGYLAARRVDYVVVARDGKLSSLASGAAQAGCLQLVSESDAPPARAYRVTRQCRPGAAR
jgi:hypothetical protein